MASQVTALVNQYQSRLLNCVQKIKDGAGNPQGFVDSNLGQLKSLVQINPAEVTEKTTGLVNYVKRAATDLSPVNLSEPDCAAFMDHYFWLALCLFIQGITFMVSRLVLAGIYGLFFDTMVAAAIAMVALPSFSYMKLQKASDMPADDQQMLLLAAGISMTTFTGFLVSGRMLGCASPPIFLLPLGMAIVLGVAGTPLGKTRPVLLSASVGSGLGFMFLYGIIAGFSLGYVIWIAALGAVAVVELQCELAALPSSPRARVAAQWRFVAAMYVANLILYLMLSHVPQIEGKER